MILEPREYDVVLGGTKQPRNYDAVLGGEEAIAIREKKQWEMRAKQIFEVFEEIKTSGNKRKLRTLSAILASVKASEVDPYVRGSVYRKQLNLGIAFNPNFDLEQIIQTFPYVQNLNISWSDLSNLSVLGCCPFPNLNKLEIYQNEIEDIAFIACYSKLTELYFHNNRITDISPLRSLTKLEKVHFTNNCVVDVSPLKDLVNLKYVWINSGVSDITSLAGLNLRLLWVEDCPLTKESRRVIKHLREKGTEVHAAGTRKSKN
jgi:hypothetical protein